MPPSQLSIESPSQPQNSSKTSASVGRSKAQLCLQKILHTILTIPPEPITQNQPTLISSRNETRSEDKSLISDLKVDDLAVAAQQTGEDPQSPAHVVDQVFEREKVEVVEEIKNGFSEKKNEVISCDQGEDCMGLLIEAAKMILGELRTEEKQQISENFDVSNAKTRPEIKRKPQRWRTVDLYEDMEPIVRSKRGRPQVLPCKFRDSILEPLTRGSRNRSTSTIISTKRRLR